MPRDLRIRFRASALRHLTVSTVLIYSVQQVG